MMKNATNLILSSAVVLLFCTLLVSCGGNSDKPEYDERLVSYMLGGVYVFNGYGDDGENLLRMIKDAVPEGHNFEKKLIKAYGEMMINPYEGNEADDMIDVLEEWWDISDKDALLAQIEELKNGMSDFKAWDYARAALLTYHGEAIGWISVSDGDKLLSAVLEKARESYSDWKTYFSDYEKGRKDWGGDSGSGDASFEAVIRLLNSEDPYIIYNHLNINKPE